MKRKRNIITIDGYGKVAMPTDINTTAMTEVVLQDSCNLILKCAMDINKKC